MNENNGVRNFLIFGLALAVAAFLYYFSVRNVTAESLRIFVTSMGLYQGFALTLILTLIYKLHNDTANIKSITDWQRHNLDIALKKKINRLWLLAAIFPISYILGFKWEAIFNNDPIPVLALAIALVALGTVLSIHIPWMWRELASFIAATHIEAEKIDRRKKILEELNKEDD